MLSVLFVYFQRADPCRIINCSILKAADLFALFTDESQKLNIHLHMMMGHLFLITLGVDFAHPSATRKSVHSMSA